VQYLPIVALLVDRALASGWARDAVAAGIVLALQCLCSYYIAYPALILVALQLMVPWWTRPARRRAIVTTAVIVGGIVAATVGPASLPYLWVRARDTLEPKLMPLPLAATRSVIDVFVPPSLAVGAVTGAILAWRSKGEHAEHALHLVMAALVCTMLAFGPGIFGWLDLYAALRHVVPGFSSLRAPVRFVVGTFFAATVLYGFAVALIAARMPSGPRRWGIIAVGIALAALSMSNAPQLRAVDIPVGTGVPPAYQWLARFSNGGPLLEWPVSKSSLIESKDSAWAMYYSTVHWLPLLNGTTGYMPAAYADLMSYARRLPDRDALEVLTACTGLEWVLAHGPMADTRRALQAIGLRQRASFERPEHPGTSDVIYVVAKPADRACPLTFVR
jgi:hypothetical protein